MNDLKRINNFLFDMDGTLYLGDQLFEGIAQLFETLYMKRKNFILLTNNSSKDKTLYQEKWKNFGIQIPLEKFLTSGEATFQYLKNNTRYHKLHIMGTDSLKEECKNFGFILDEESPDAVVIGYDTTLNYQALCKTCLLLQKGLPYYATHPDINCPSEKGPLPDCGAFIEMIYASINRRPKIFGKPFPEMVEAALTRIGGNSTDTAIVGDRLYTDIEMGYRANLTTILVLSGETKKEDLKNLERKPDYILENVAEICELI